MMRTYAVTFEVRKVGAIGSFRRYTQSTRASAPEQARDNVFAALHAEGYETRGHSVTELRETGRPADCECDNTHERNRSCCRVCWDAGFRTVAPEE